MVGKATMKCADIASVLGVVIDIIPDASSSRPVIY
jgi:hypothetical protein